MRLTISIVALLILFAGAATAATVTLDNGDVLSGNILRTEGPLLVIQNQHLGIVRVPLKAVSNIEADGAFTVVLGTGDRVTGLLETDGDGNLTIENESGVVSTTFAEVHGIMPTPMNMAYANAADAPADDVDAAIEQAVESDWTGEADLGFNWQTGNTERLGLVFGLKLTHETEKSKSTLRGGIIYTEDDKERSANRQFLALQHDIKLTDKWYLFGLLATARDEFKDIDFRASLTPGIGYIFGDNEKWKLVGEVGPTATYTDWSEIDSEWTFDLFVAVKGELQVFDEAKLIQNIFWYPSMTNWPDGRLISETALEQPLSGSLFLKIAFIVNYDTTVVAPTKRTDTNLLITLAYKF